MTLRDPIPDSQRYICIVGLLLRYPGGLVLDLVVAALRSYTIERADKGEKNIASF